MTYRIITDSSNLGMNHQLNENPIKKGQNHYCRILSSLYDFEDFIHNNKVISVKSKRLIRVFLM